MEGAWSLLSHERNCDPDLETYQCCCILVFIIHNIHILQMFRAWLSELYKCDSLFGNKGNLQQKIYSIKNSPDRARVFVHLMYTAAISDCTSNQVVPIHVHSLVYWSFLLKHVGCCVVKHNQEEWECWEAIAQLFLCSPQAISAWNFTTTSNIDLCQVEMYCGLLNFCGQNAHTDHVKGLLSSWFEVT